MNTEPKLRSRKLDPEDFEVSWEFINTYEAMGGRPELVAKLRGIPQPTLWDAIWLWICR